jgi:hypothetical protein
MRTILSSLGALLIAAMAASSPAGAAVVERKTLEDLAAESPVVVIGTVMGAEFVRLANVERPYTKYNLLLQQVVIGEEKLRAKAGDRIALHFGGGLSEKGYFEVIVGMPELELGQTYLLMLRGGDWSVNPVTGWSQGALRIVGLNKKGDKLLISLDDGALVGFDNGFMQFKAPDLKAKQTGVQQGGGGSLMIEGRQIAPRVLGAAPKAGAVAPNLAKGNAASKAASIYREDNAEALAAQDLKREAKPESGQNDRYASVVEALGAKPVLLSDFLDLLEKHQAQHAAALGELKFSLAPSPLPNALESESPPLPKNPQN